MDKRTKKKITKWFEDCIALSQKNIIEFHAAIDLLKEGKCHYRVHLRSSWGHEGEEDITYNAQPGHSLKKAAKDAEEKFMRVNKRSDVQADRFVHLMIDNGQFAYVKYPKNKKK